MVHVAMTMAIALIMVGSVGGKNAFAQYDPQQTF
jgi:hypothetical protein